MSKSLLSSPLTLGLILSTLLPVGSRVHAANVGNLVWPKPPAPARVRYVQSFTGPADLGIRPSFWGRAVGLLTGQNQRTLLNKPFGLAVNSDGSLLVTDTGSCAVYWFDVANKKWASWSRIGPHTLISPVAAGRHGDTLLVVDSGIPALLALDTKGQFRFAVTNQLQRPAGLAIIGQKIFVADAAAHKILCFDPAGKLTGQFGGRGVAPGEFNFPTHLAAFGQSHLLVTDSMNSRVQVLSPEGEPLQIIGSPGDGPGHFSRPKGVAVDKFGRVYVADALFDNLQVFDIGGQLLMDFGQSGHELGEFWLPGAVVAGPGNRIYIADTYNARVQVFQYVGEQ